MRDRHGRLYFAATDTTQHQLAANGVESQWLLDQLDDCRARRQVLILDCCFSGAFADGMRKSAEVDVGEDLRSQSRGRAILTASRAYEYSFEGKPIDGVLESGSVFTTGLVEGIRTGDADDNGDGYISVEEAYDYAYSYVKRHNQAQTPQRWLIEADGKIWLARNPSAVRPSPAPVSRNLRNALLSSIGSVRMAAVTELGRWYSSGDAAKAVTAKHELEAVAKDGSNARVATAARAILAQTPSPSFELESPPVRRLDGHVDWIRSVVFGPRGLLAWAGHGNGIRLCRGDDYDNLHQLMGHADWIRGLAFHPDGSRLASAGVDGGVRIWDTATRETVAVFAHERAMNCVAFNHDGTLLASAGRSGDVQLSDGRTLGGHQDEVLAAAFCPNRNLLATASEDKTVRLWDVEDSGTPIVLAHPAPVHGVAFSPSGELVASAGADGVIRIWDSAGGKKAIHLLTEHEGAVHAVAFSPNGDLLASASADGTIRLWNPGVGEHLYAFEEHRGAVRSVAFSADGRLLASGGNDRQVLLWDLIPST